ncbi:UPF0183-domain-containing protein [Irpex rosettiformis]|uniref:UPF0183-domain-containing protein n=1 Tax=Irpex rosettiformis TaxID=378272 RepID=A0ACB8UCJ7_9APHY|nr:UPF0183-domain-containing protein [Irpex rosettiformis]
MKPELNIDIQPGVGLGHFQLGKYYRHIPLNTYWMSLWTSLDLLRRDSHLFPDVDVKYDPDSAITPVILHLRPHLDLLFSGQQQRLHQICLKKLRDPHPPVELSYKGKLLSSPHDTLQRVGVSKAFGPTYPGEDLMYPGVWFSFREDGPPEQGKVSSNPEDKSQEVKRVIISQKNENNESEDVLSEVRECEAMQYGLLEAIVKVHEGVDLSFYGVERPVRIKLGVTTAQDLMLDLGSPLRIHYREDDRMTIHQSNVQEDPDISGGYFYNYFQYGIDFLISGTTHVVKKIVLHSNIPGTALFQRYQRCPWAIQGLPEDDEDDTPPRKWFYERFEDISHFLSPGETPPTMRLDRTMEEEGLTLPSPATRLLGFDGAVLEVTESALVAAVTLF